MSFLVSFPSLIVCSLSLFLFYSGSEDALDKEYNRTEVKEIIRQARVLPFPLSLPSPFPSSHPPSPRNQTTKLNLKLVFLPFARCLSLITLLCLSSWKRGLCCCWREGWGCMMTRMFCLNVFGYRRIWLLERRGSDTHIHTCTLIYTLTHTHTYTTHRFLLSLSFSLSLFYREVSQLLPFAPLLVAFLSGPHTHLVEHSLTCLGKWEGGGGAESAQNIYKHKQRYQTPHAQHAHSCSHIHIGNMASDHGDLCEKIRKTGFSSSFLSIYFLFFFVRHGGRSFIFFH